jgi:cytochrome oxidase Cu insertion factor (SCO1/SenC/PrrC family)
MQLDIDRIIEEVRSASLTSDGGTRLATMLGPNGKHFDGLSTADAELVRGHILAGFERCGLPDSALPVVVDELRTSLSPVVLAGAARALRRLEAVEDEMRTLLTAAGERIEFRDEYVSLDTATCCGAKKVTARQELAVTIQRLPNTAKHCCSKGAARSATAPDKRFFIREDALRTAEGEDQSGQRFRLDQLLVGRTTLMAFFYTRCMNPNKCSLTITRLGRAAVHASEHSTYQALQVIAVTYDGEHDEPSRLLAYGSDRNYPFGDNVRMVRFVSGWNSFRHELDLQVGYGGLTVNNHARELFLIDPSLETVPMDSELLAQPRELMRAISGSAAG